MMAMPYLLSRSSLEMAVAIPWGWRRSKDSEMGSGPSWGYYVGNFTMFV